MDAIEKNIRYLKKVENIKGLDRNIQNPQCNKVHKHNRSNLSLLSQYFYISAIYRVLSFTGIFLFSLFSYSQSNIIVSGNSVTETEGSVSYSIGQIDYKSTSGSSGLLNEGMQQPLEFYTLDVENEDSISTLFKVYPNPVNTTFQLQIDDFSVESYIATLYTLEGKIIFNRTVYPGNQEISLEELPQGTYLLNILKEDKIVKMFKIIKY